METAAVFLLPTFGAPTRNALSIPADGGEQMRKRRQ
jgi:hypothetical protein